jgi:homocysteine S-methyltransferase
LSPSLARSAREPFAGLLEGKPVLVLDGALATELERRGADLNDPPWSARVLLESPAMIRAVHLNYLRAGADIVTTASYQATFEGFARRGLDAAQSAALLQTSVRLALEARDEFLAEHPDADRPLVAASVGPYGAYLADGSEYRGDYALDESALMDFHRPRLAALLAAGPDLLAFETVPCLREARAVARLLAEFPGATAWISFSARDGAHTCDGEPVSECAALLDAFPQVTAVGSNCTAPRFIPKLIRELRRGTAKPIVVYPNSGETYDASDKTWHGVTDCEAFGVQARAWYEAGARVIGGCCRTTPEHVGAVAAWARGLWCDR